MHGTALMTALRDGVPSSQLTGLLKSIGAQIDEYAHQVFTQAEYAKMGSDETSLIARYSREIFVDNNRELVRSMKANPQLMDELRTALEEEMEQVSTELVRCRLDQMPQLQRNFAHIDGALQIIHTISAAQ